MKGARLINLLGVIKFFPSGGEFPASDARALPANNGIILFEFQAF